MFRKSNNKPLIAIKRPKSQQYRRPIVLLLESMVDAMEKQTVSIQELTSRLKSAEERITALESNYDISSQEDKNQAYKNFK